MSIPSRSGCLDCSPFPVPRSLDPVRLESPADLLLKIDQYPTRKNPDVREPTLSLGTLAGGAYQWQHFTGKQQIASKLFPALELTVAQLVQALV